MASSHSPRTSHRVVRLSASLEEKINKFIAAPIPKDLGEAIAYFKKNALPQDKTTPEYFYSLLGYALFYFHINRIEEGTALLNILMPPSLELVSALKEKANPNIKWTYDLNSLQKAIQNGITTLKCFSIKREFIAEFKTAAEAPHSLLSFIKKIRYPNMSLEKAHLCLKLCMEIFYTNPAVLGLPSSTPQNASSTSSSSLVEAKFEQSYGSTPPFQNQNQIDNYFQSKDSPTNHPIREFLYLICFMVKIGEETSANILLRQLIRIHPQPATYSSIRLTEQLMLHPLQRSKIEFTTLFKKALETLEIKEDIVLSNLRPHDPTDEIQYWADLLIFNCFLQHIPGKKGFLNIKEHLSPSQTLEIVPILINIGRDINSIIFLECAKELAEAHSHEGYIFETEILIDAHKKNSELNHERFNIQNEKNLRRIKQRQQKGQDYLDKILQAMLNNKNPYDLKHIIQPICEILPKNAVVLPITIHLLKIYLQLLYQSNDALKPLLTAKEEKTEIKVTPKENKLEKMETLSLQEYSDLTNDQLNALTSQEHYSYHVRNIYAAAIECKETFPFNSIQFDLFKNKEWQSSIDQRLQVVYQTPVTDSTPVVLFMLAGFFVGIGKIQGATWLLQLLQSQTSSIVVNSKLSELQAKTTSINLELPKSQAISTALNPKKLESSIPILKKALEHNPAILEKVLLLFQRPPKPTQFLDLLISIVKESHPAIIAFVLREYCFGYSHKSAIRATALPIPLLEGPGPRQKPAKKAKSPVNEEKKTQPPQNISSPIPQPVEIQLPPAALTPNISSPPKAIKSKSKNPKAKKDRRDKKKNNVTEKKENSSSQSSTSFQPTDSTTIMKQLFQMTAGGHKHKETKLNTNETKNVASQQMSSEKLPFLESSLLDFLPYISPITITKIQTFLDNIKAIGATAYTYGSAQDHWLLRKTGNHPTFLPNDFDLKINCGNLSSDQMERVIAEAKKLIPEITQQKKHAHYDFIEGKMDADHICNITLEKTGYKKTQDPIVISDCQSEITPSGVTFNLEAYPELKHNLEQKIFSIRPLTASPTETELSAQSVLMRVVKKVHSTCQLSELKPDKNVSRFFSFEGALQFFNTIPSKIHLELSKLFDWVGKQIASRKKTSADFCKESIGGLLPFMQAYLVFKNHHNNINVTELLQHILVTENPEKLFQYNHDSRSFPIDDKLMMPQRNLLLPTHAIANTMLR